MEMQGQMIKGVASPIVRVDVDSITPHHGENYSDFDRYFFSSQGKMSQEDDCSSNVEIEGAEVWLGNEESGGDKGSSPKQKEVRPPFHPWFRAHGSSTAEGWGIYSRLCCV